MVYKVCQHCSKECNSKSNYYYHIKLHFDEQGNYIELKPNSLECKYCDKVFKCK